MAARFHAGVAAGTAAAAARGRRRRGLDTVVLSGGVFQNRLLLEQTAARSSAHGLRVPAAPSACRPTTAASPTARRRWRRALTTYGVPDEPGRARPLRARRRVARERPVRFACQATVP